MAQSLSAVHPDGLNVAGGFGCSNCIASAALKAYDAFSLDHVDGLSNTALEQHKPAVQTCNSSSIVFVFVDK